MELFVFVGSIIGFLILLFIVDKMITKWLGVNKSRISETPGKKWEQWGNGLIFLIFLITLWFVMGQSDSMRILHLLSFLVMQFGLKAILEFVYLKGSRQYVASSILLLMNVLAVIVISSI